MSIRKDVARMVKLREFHRSVEQLLTPGDRDYLFYALKEYNTYKSVAKLMLALNSCLDTPEKLDLLPSIRDLLPKQDRRKFDSLAPYNRMAHPAPPSPAAAEAQTTPQARATGKKPGAPNGEVADGAGGEAGGEAHVRTVLLERASGESLGFSIRGGREHGTGIFISQVDSFSLAERSGLLPGDCVVSVNGVNFASITHHSAVLILKSHDQLEISVTNIGQIPGRSQKRKSLIWVDTTGKEDTSREIPEPPEEDWATGDRLLASPGRHKIVLHVEKRGPLGFSVRGGKEYSLGVYVSQVEKDSLAEEYGLKVGDQILDVNGHSFSRILHQEAVTIFRTYPTLIMTIRSLGKLPVMVTHEPSPTDSTDAGHRSPNASSSTGSHLQHHTHTTLPVTTDTLSPSSTPSSPTSPPPLQTSTTPQKPSRSKATQTTATSTRSPPTLQLKWTNLRESVSRRSQSFKELLRPRSIAVLHPIHSHHSHPHHSHPHHPHSHNSHSHGSHPHHLHHPHNAHPHHTHSSHTHRHRHYHALDLAQPRHRAGSDSALFRHSNQHRALSPLTSSQAATSHQQLSGPSHPSPGAPQSNQTKSPSQVPPSTQPGGTDEPDNPKFFQHGMGTQLMLASLSSSAEGLLMDSARRLLNEEEMQALTGRLREYETSKEVEPFAEFLVSLLDTPTKMTLLADVRSVLAPSDLAQFDDIVSPHEIAALQKRASFGGRENWTKATEGERERRVTEEEEEEEEEEGGRKGEEEGDSLSDTREREDEKVTEREKEEERGREMGREYTQREMWRESEERNREMEREERVGYPSARKEYIQVQSNVQNHHGYSPLKRASAAGKEEEGEEEKEEEAEKGEGELSDLGVFGTKAANSLLSNAISDEPAMTEEESLDSFPAGNDDYNTESWDRDHTHSGSPVVIEIPKSAPQLGVTITGGIDTPTPGVFVTEVSETGAAGIDGFLQPGFEIIEVDGVGLQDLPHDTAARKLAMAFRSQRPTIELVVMTT